MEPIGDELGLQITSVLTHDGRYLQVTVGPYKRGPYVLKTLVFHMTKGPIRSYYLEKRVQASSSTYRRVAFKKGRHSAQLSLPTRMGGGHYMTSGPWRRDRMAGNTHG